MVAINKILLPGCTGEGCGGETGTCTDSRVHHRNAESRVPATRNHRRTQPLVNNLYQGMTLDAVTELYCERSRDYSPSLGRWMEQDPAQYINGANTYQFVNSSPVGNVDASGLYKLPGVRKPVLIKTGARHSMPGGRYYVNYYDTQGLGDVITDGESPAKLEGFRLAHEILNGLKSLSGVGDALVLIAKAINDNGAGRWVYMGRAFPEITKVYFCNGKLQSVTVKESRPTLWMLDPSEQGQLGGGFVLGPQLTQDHRFFADLFHTIRELVKESGSE